MKILKKVIPGIVCGGEEGMSGAFSDVCVLEVPGTLSRLPLATGICDGDRPKRYFNFLKK